MFKGSYRKKSVVIALIVVVLLTASVGVMSAGYRDMNVSNWVRERNPDNLLEYTMPVEDYTKGDGVILNIEQDGTIKITGDVPLKVNANGNPAYIQWFYSLGKMLLPAGKYTFTCEGRFKNCDLIAQYKDANGKTVDWVSNSNKKTVIFTEPVEITLSVRVLKCGPVQAEFRPILNKGANPVDYYVIKSIGD